MPFFLTPEQKQSTFRVVLWLAAALLLCIPGPILAPFIVASASPTLSGFLAIVAALAPMAGFRHAGFRHVRRHYLRSSFYNA